ncbi:MAG: PASTA domain-containing protein [Firmicutes bacterium]|nr:PASTA domain-containing protein [Bacillota bacterium]
MKAIATTHKNRTRLIFVFLVICACMLALAVRLGYQMLIRGDEYAQRATRQQTRDSVVLATRGSILDRNGSELAISATTNTIWVRPDSVKGNGKNDEEIQLNIYTEANTLANLLHMDYEEVRSIITSDRKLLKVAKNVDKEDAEKIRAAKLAGIEIVEDAKRYYPLGIFASHVIGTTTDDNVGLLGLENYYNRYLAGINGREISSKDSRSNAITYGTSKFYGAQDGYTLVTTIDENIQYIVERHIAECKETTKGKRVMCLVMEPKTASVLAMAQTDEYDPNDPRSPVGTEEDKAAFEEMTDAEKVNYWNTIWRNFCITDTYEPGSTFKLITTSIALDKGVTYPEETFYCNSAITVAGQKLKCWYYPRSHGQETLVTAVENSCNPVMVQLAQRLGLTRYYEGLDSFALTERTGIDYPGESFNILQNKSTAGPVGLATMAYGQGIAVTPISLVTAISSIANEGKLMKPHFIKELRDSEGNLVDEYQPVIRNISMSAQTAADMLKIMEDVVGEGGGGTAKIAGYRIGGKTGTAQKPEGGGYSKTDVYGSFIGIAPIDDPKFAILVVVDSPRGVLYGSQTAAPCAREIMKEIFTYMGIEPNYTEEELEAIGKSKVEVPDLTGRSAENAIGVLGGKYLGYTFAPAIEDYKNLIVTDQYPKPGTEVTKGTKVTIYYETEPGEDEDSGEDVED